MTHQLNRRDVLRGIAAGAVTLSYAGQVTAGGTTRYLVLLDNPGAKRRVERAGFDVKHALADGTAVLAVGPSSKRSTLEGAKGVVEVAADFRLELEGPALRERYESDGNGKGKGDGNGKGGGPSSAGPDHVAGADDSTDDELFPLQWDKQDGTTDAAIAHERSTGAGTTIAIIDTGVDVDDHPDLPNVDADAGRLFREGEVLSGTGEVAFPADVTDLCAGTTTITDHVADDVYYHGTHVAGIAGASRAGTTGIVGTAPDTTIVPLRVFYWVEAPADCNDDEEIDDDETAAALFASFGDILTAIDYAADIGVDAMNMSIGTLPIPPQGNAGGVRGVMERVINSAVSRGSVVSVSAGNSSANLQQGGYFTLPNSISGAMSISATGPNDELVFYSNYGTDEIDVGAPGGGYETLEKTLCQGDGTIDGCEDDPETEEDECECDPPAWPYPTNLVLSTADPDSYVGQLVGGAQYLYAAGTSMAAPQVTGTAALVREVAPDANAKQVEKAIEQGAEHVPGESDAELGAGRLNCDRALDAAAID